LETFMDIPERASAAKLTEMKPPRREPLGDIPGHINPYKEKRNAARLRLL